MAQPDYRGARGSNAGDDFHELWALRQALALLDQDAGLTAVTVEGLRAEDESGARRWIRGMAWTAPCTTAAITLLQPNAS